MLFLISLCLLKPQLLTKYRATVDIMYPRMHHLGVRMEILRRIIVLFQRLNRSLLIQVILLVLLIY